MQNKTKIWVGGMAASAAFFAALIQHEGFRSKPYLDSVGVPTIGIGSTVYPDGRKVKLTDPAITKKQAIAYAKHHSGKDENKFRALLAGVKLSQAEYDVYLDFAYNFGIHTFAKSSMLRNLKYGDYKAACRSLLKYKFAGGRDCSVRKNNCIGVWNRQLDRYNKCMAANQ
ncbi:Phage-related lysozyme (muraminidase) [Neisseria animaloris]|uniref:lysozyme n=1 Tax=Neisseria animaloris TaxID=326522 RepID=UPI000A199F55|nr:lysozyme [Neisseria animaloris]OSI06793.1 lysozyme [Neisseria animaloris]VEH86573.1 Phage-related lysozyme (muraminidase) [Neisseria animaloris]